MPELNDAVATAVARWREYRKPCPGEYHHLTTEGPPCCLAYETRAPIPDCGGTGYIQPPEAKALIEAVTVPDSHHEACPKYGGCFVDNPKVQDSYKTGRPSCQGTSRVPRDWEEIGEWGLVGALLGVVHTWVQPNMHLAWAQSLWGNAQGWFDQPHPSTTALAAVDKALEQMYGGKP